MQECYRCGSKEVHDLHKGMTVCCDECGAVSHDLKTVQPFFDDVASGNKTFEIRINDRDYKVGDILKLREYSDGEYTGRFLYREITYIINYQREKGYVVMAIKI